MAGFKLNLFKGLRPRTSALKLPAGEAQIAENVDLGSGDIEPWFDKSTEQAISAGRETRTIYRFDNNGDPLWLEWNDYVDVARGPVKGDSLERTYYTGDSTGTGAPKMTNTDLVGSSGGPYPEDWVYIGVPAPGTAPTVITADLPEDVPVDERFIPSGGLKSDELVVDNVNFTVYPGSGTANQQWTANAAAAGVISFDVETGKSFRVTEVINANKVKLESASAPGIFAKTFNSDKTTVNDWNPYDEGGTTQEADFIGWRIPVGIETTIAGHKLQVGDVITVSAVSTPLSWATSLSEIHYEQSWLAPTLKTVLGSSFYNVPNARVTPSAISGAAQWSIVGSFYYDVDRAASTSQVEDRTYVYTYVTDNGEEGPPSPPSLVTSTLDGSLVNLTGLELPPTIGYNITHMRVYRTNSSVAGTEFQFVKEIPVTQLTTDAIPSTELGEVISSTTWDPPDPGMIGITEMPNGMLVGFKGKNLYFCEPYFPHAWPPEYDQAVGHQIVGLAALGNSVAVMTKGPPYLLTGSHPRNVNVRSTKVNQSCSNKESIATDGDNVYYASPDGLVEITINGIRVATENYIEKKDWTAYDPSTMVGSFHEGRYYGFHDFDVSFIDPVISAEVSGSISVANELDITAGGREVILTLTNDVWVAAGTSFDNQRQNIIDGLTATTGQSLGWNNIIRDTVLLVGNVVRTSDTVVTITLPAAPGYEVTANEIVAPLIPASALLLSNTAVPTGSTFTITALTPEQTVQIGGSVSGSTEASIVSGGNTVTLTLTNDIWVSGVTFDSMRQGIIDGLISTTDEANGWNDQVPNLIPLTSVVRSSDLIVTITLPAVPGYSVTVDESIYALVPAGSIVAAGADLVSINSVGIVATGAVSSTFGGSILTATESQIVAGALEITITLVNDTWIAAGTGPIGTTAESQTILDALIATTSQAFGWNNVVVPGIEVADLVRTSPTVATITLDPEATFSIVTSESVGMTIPGPVLTGAVPVIVNNTFGITAQAPTTCILTGTLVGFPNEDDIVAGGKTMIFTLTNDTWLPAGSGPVGTTANTQAILDGLDSLQSETFGWDAVVQPGIEVADLVRTSDTVITITLDPEATYDISFSETISLTIPAEALAISPIAVTATPFPIISPTFPATVALSGTITSATSQDIYNGGETIILTVTNDQWVASGATFNAIRQQIIDGLDAATSPTLGWNNIMRDLAIAVTDVVRTNNTVVTITLPPGPYDVNANEVITATMPATVFDSAVGATIATPTATITADSTANSRIYVYEDDQDAVRDPQFHVSFFDPDLWTDYSPALPGLPDDGWQTVQYIEGLSRLVIGVAHPVPPFEAVGTIYTSDDDGVTWDARTSAIPIGTIAQGMPQRMWSMNTVDGDVVFNYVSRITPVGAIQYSVDGITWADITGNFEAAQVIGPGRIHDMVVGGNHVYASINAGIVPSADLSTASTVANAWGTAITSPLGATGIIFSGLGSGNGRLISCKGNSFGTIDLQWMAHGGSSFSADGVNVNPLPGSSGVFVPNMIAFGDNKWVMFDSYGTGWKVDIDGQAAGYEEDASNWTRITANPFGQSLMGIWYDTELGWVAVAGPGPFSFGALQVRVLTSPDLVTWTLREEFDSVSKTTQFWLGQWKYTSQKKLTGTGLD